MKLVREDSVMKGAVHHCCSNATGQLAADVLGAGQLPAPGLSSPAYSSWTHKQAKCLPLPDYLAFILIN